MKNFFFVAIFLVTFGLTEAQQLNKYSSGAGEINFSSAVITTSSGMEESGVVRFAPWFNLQLLRNWDRKHAGLFFGLTVRNIGFIYESDSEKWKVRTYNAGIPIGIKIGNMKGFFLYGGYEIEAPFHYREKYFKDDSKERRSGAWMSKRVNPYTQAVFFGLNLPKGLNVKFKYYLTEFFNTKFDNSNITDSRDLHYPGNGLAVNDPDYIAPREILKVHIMYVSLTWNLFKDSKLKLREHPKEVESVKTL